MEANVAIPNEQFDESLEYNAALPMESQLQCLPVIITKPGRIVSFDESHITLDQMDSSKSAQERIVCRKGDTGECLSNKERGGDATVVGGSTAAGDRLPPMFIFPTTTWPPSWTDGAPESSLVDPATNKFRQATFWGNKKGGMTFELGLRYLQNNVAPCFPDMSPDNPVVIICDGHGSHVTLEVVEYCRRVGFVLCLRPPHTSTISQGEDTTNFPFMKAEFRMQKHRVLSSLLDVGKLPKLRWSDLMACIKTPYMMSFSRERNLKAWSVIGVVPFTRKVYWDLVRAERKVDIATSKTDLNFNVLRFGKRSLTANVNVEEDEEEEEDVHVEQPRTKGPRLDSSKLWARGPITSDEGYEIIRLDREARDAKARELEQRKKDRSEVANAKHYQDVLIAEAAIAKIQAVGYNVKNAGLVVGELKAIVSSRNKKPEGRKAELETQVQSIMDLCVHANVQTPPANVHTPTPTATTRPGGLGLYKDYLNIIYGEVNDMYINHFTFWKP